MDTPLFDAVQGYVDKGMSRFHMPGHKGTALDWLGGATHYDVTEAEGLDSLYEATGAIAETERLYAQLYGAAGSLLCAGGSTLCIQTMLALAAPIGSTIIAGRGVHAAAVNAMALLDLRPIWAYPETDGATGLSGAVGAQVIRERLEQSPDAAAVYITSPSYYGVLCDIPAIAAVCREFSVPLLVDNAHGAHLKFLPGSLHPMDLGADMCCDSLHKTLPVLTGGAVLHVKQPRFLPQAKRMMSIFGSTSPSYLILLSADRALAYLHGDIRQDLVHTSDRMTKSAQLAVQKGLALPRGICDPARLVLGFGAIGYTRAEFAAHIRGCRIEPEYIGGRFCVLLPNSYNTDEDFSRLEEAIVSAEHRQSLALPSPIPCMPRPGIELREALFAPTRRIAVDEAEGEIAGGMVTPCPPGIPIVVAGEKIDKHVVASLKSYGIFTVDVLH